MVGIIVLSFVESSWCCAPPAVVVVPVVSLLNAVVVTFCSSAPSSSCDLEAVVFSVLLGIASLSSAVVSFASLAATIWSVSSTVDVAVTTTAGIMSASEVVAGRRV